MSINFNQGEKYEIFILGFKDSTSYNILKIPPTTGNAYYKKPFVVNIQFQPSKTFVLEDCNFDFGKATLQETSFTVLDELVAYLNRKDEERIEIGGHTDNVGNADLNLQLSKSRAQAIVNYLKQKGIPESRFQLVDGKGANDPIATNATESGKAQNRRVVITFLK